MASRFTRSVPVTINDVLDGHVALDLQCLDRLYLHGYLAPAAGRRAGDPVPEHRGYPVPSPACLQQIGDAFRRRVASFAEANHIPVVTLKAADRNIEVMQPYLDKAAATGRSQVAAIGVAQELQRVLIARQRHTDPGKCPQFSFDKKDRRVTVYYFYLWDAGFGPAFIKICTYCPWPVKIWVNGHEWAKQQARKIGFAFTELSNGFASGRGSRRAAEDLRRAAARHHRGVLPALAAPAAAAARRRRPAGRVLVGAARWPRSRCPAPSCSPSPATPGPSSRRWSPTTSTSAAPTPSRSSSAGGSSTASSAPPRARSRPRSSPAAPRSPSTPSTGTPGSSSTSKTAGRCASRPSSTRPPTCGSAAACTTWTNSRTPRACDQRPAAAH